MKPSTAKPFGFDLRVEFYTTSIVTEERNLHCRKSSEAAARRWAMLKKHAKRVVSITPLNEADYCRAYGDPRIKSKFS